MITPRLAKTYRALFTMAGCCARHGVPELRAGSPLQMELLLSAIFSKMEPLEAICGVERSHCRRLRLIDFAEPE